MSNAEGCSCVSSAFQCVCEWIRSLTTDCRGIWGGAHPKTQAAKRRKQVRKAVTKAILSGQGRYGYSGPMTIGGRGGFFGDAWKAIKKWGPRVIGAGIGAAAGGPAGAAAGWKTGQQASKVLGWGAYGVPWSVSRNIGLQQPSLISDGNLPQMMAIGDSGINIKHSDYLGQLVSSTSFNNTAFSFNPGLETTFPWLSGIAINFQQYRVNSAMLVFKSSIPDGIAAFGSLGTVMMAVNMNPGATAATTDISMEQMKFGASAKPSENIFAPIEASPDTGSPMRSLYVRTGAVPSGQSIQNFDHCLMQIATNGQSTANVVLGKVYITYDITFLNPFYPGYGANVSYCKYNLTSFSNTAWFGTSRTQVVDTLGMTFSDNNTVVFPTGTGGKWKVAFTITGTAATTSVPTITLTNATGSAGIIPQGVSTTSCFYEYNFTVTNPTLPVIFAVTSGTGVVPTSATYATFYVYQLPPTWA